MSAKTYNPTKLLTELEATGLPVIGCSSDGRVDTSRGLTTAEQATVNQIKTAHDPTDTVAQRRESALAYLKGVNFAGRKAAIDASNLAASTKALLRTFNRTEWALAVLVLGLITDDPGE